MTHDIDITERTLVHENEPMLYMRSEGVEPRFILVCATHGEPEQFTTQQVLNAGLTTLIKGHVDHLHKPEKP